MLLNHCCYSSKHNSRPHSQFELVNKLHKPNVANDGLSKDMIHEYDSSNSDSVVSRNSINKNQVDVSISLSDKTIGSVYCVTKQNYQAMLLKFRYSYSNNNNNKIPVLNTVI